MRYSSKLTVVAWGRSAMLQSLVRKSFQVAAGCATNTVFFEILAGTCIILEGGIIVFVTLIGHGVRFDEIPQTI